MLVQIFKEITLRRFYGAILYFYCIELNYNKNFISGSRHIILHTLHIYITIKIKQSNKAFSSAGTLAENLQLQNHCKTNVSNMFYRIKKYCLIHKNVVGI